MKTHVSDRAQSTPFELPEDIRDLKARAAAFVEKEIRPIEEKVAKTETIDLADFAMLRKKARAAGFSMLNMPVKYGGKDLSMLGQVAIEEEAGKATNGLGFAVADRGPRELVEICSDDQVERFVIRVIRGEAREAWAVTEPGAGSDVSAISTRAVRQGDDWVINGEKWFVTDADTAAFFIVLVWADDEQTLFLVRRDNPGIRFDRMPGFMHDPYVSKHAEMRFVDCRVPDADRVRSSGQEGRRRGSPPSVCSSPRAAAAPQSGSSSSLACGLRGGSHTDIRSLTTRASSSLWPTRSPSLPPLGC